MYMQIRKISSFAASALIAASIVPAGLRVSPAAAKYGTGKNIVEHLDRGIYAVKSGSGMFVSWRWNADDADNVFAGNKGAEFWDARPAKTVLDQNGNKISGLSLSMNFLIYWDGDLERELFSGTTISKMTSTSKIDYLLNADGCDSNNSTKAVPCMTVDLFGDWREELVMRTSDNNKLRIWCTTSPTDIRLTTLMHDVQYRSQNCCQQSAYNQPPHTSFFLGTGYQLPERPAVKVLGGSEVGVKPFEIADGKLVKSLKVNDTASQYNWSVEQGLDVGNEVFGDRKFRFTSVPEELRGAEWIRTACDSKKFTSDEATFTAAQDITVFVGVDTRAESNAAWLSDWTKTEMTMTDDGNPNITYNVYRKEAKGGQKVTLGAVNMTTAVNYVVAVTEYHEPNTTTTANNASVHVTLLGDVNLDGFVTISDSVAILQYIANKDKYSLTDTARANADVYNVGDGITAKDALAIQKLDSGIITSLPETE